MVKGHLAHQKFVGQDSQAPEIDGRVVLCSLEQLRGCVVEGATVGLSAGAVAESCPAEVAELAYPVRQDDVLRLDVTVSDAFFVQVDNCLRHMLYLHSRLLFCKYFPLLQLMEESPFLHVLQHEVDKLLVAEDAVNLKDILVAAEALDLDFFDQLLDHLIFLDYLL